MDVLDDLAEPCINFNMDTKISPQFWSDPDIETLQPEVKLTALWILTAHPNLAGWVEASPRRFAFETGLKEEWFDKTIEALSKTFIRASKGVWIRNFIRNQIGSGTSLQKNNLFKPLVRAIEALPDTSIKEELQREYPEIGEALELQNSTDFQSPCQGLAKPQRREEKRREENKEGSAEGNQDETKLRLGAIFRRRPGTRWSEKELKSYRAICPVDQTQLQLIERYYSAPEDDRNPLYRRKDLQTLLNNWNGEVDRAGAWARINGIQIEEAPAASEPEGWQELLSQLYPGSNIPAEFSSLPLDLQRELKSQISKKEKNGEGSK